MNLFLIPLMLVLSTAFTFQDEPNPVVVDCDESSTCIEIVIDADPIEHACLELDGTAFSDPCAIRGQFDASLWSDAGTGTLWLVYTRASLFLPDRNRLEAFAPRFDTHLARSDDGGSTWEFVAKLTEGEAYDHPEQGPGIIANEVADIAQNPDGTWSMLWLQYTRPYMMDAYNDPVVARKDAPSPEALAEVEAQLHLSGWGESEWFRADYTPSLENGLFHCLGMTEPTIASNGVSTYVAVECLSVDITDPTFPLIYEDWTMELFEWLGDRYTHVGTLLTYDDAVALVEGDGLAMSLAQPDIARSRSGDWLLLVTPANGEQDPPYQGCHVLTIDDLATASVARDADGTPVVRAIITAESEHLGAGQCTYSSESETGVMFSVGFEEPETLRLHLVATGLHP